MRELPPEISHQMACSMVEDRNLLGRSANEKLASAYRILSHIELSLDSGDGGWDVDRNALARKVASLFGGKDSRSKKAQARTAINRAMRLWEAYNRQRPAGQCTFEDFLTRYALEEHKAVPWAKGVEIITGEERHHKLKRAIKKFGILVAKLAERRRPAKSTPPSADEEDDEEPDLQFFRRPPLSQADAAAGRTYFFLPTVDHCPALPDPIPEGYSFYAKDVYSLWRAAGQLKVRRPPRKKSSDS